MSQATGSTAVWVPSGAQTPMGQFASMAGKITGRGLEKFADLHAWSVNEPELFWRLVWDFCDVKGDRGERVLINGDDMPNARFFPDATLNFAENLLTTTGGGDAILFKGEDKAAEQWSWDQLRGLVSRLQQGFRAMGLAPGDRVCAMMPNIPVTVACMLAAASLGLTWSSCSPDFGEQGVTERFAQISPKLLITVDSYWYNGKLQDTRAKVKAIAGALAVPVLVVPYAGDGVALTRELPSASRLPEFIAGYDAAEIEFVRLPFSHPLYILFSSGTTGVPKCIVHSAGGTLLQHLKEHRLHCGLGPQQKLFYYTTCGWMMWNWLVSGLAVGATICLFDGSPFAPHPNVLFNYADEAEFDVFGTSAKFIDTLRKLGVTPKETHQLSKLRIVASTGSPLSPDGFDFVYDGIKDNVQLTSISGGTDIVSCFVLGNPLQPVWKGEIQGPGLGLAVDVWDEDGRSVRREKGELVCLKPFPSMPLGFWNDEDGRRYREAYFDRFGNVWCHGDFAEWTEHDGIVIHGRSDATLNPGGVRIGTSEIYNQVDNLPEVAESLCIGQTWDDDVRIILFVRLTDGASLTEELSSRIKWKIRTGASPRHVPAKIVAVTDIPRTKSGKIVELAVREIVHGRPVKNMSALANPEALRCFEDLAELRS